eukprot:6207029-Pleurochrysis_carterae.AAC.1
MINWIKLDFTPGAIAKALSLPSGSGHAAASLLLQSSAACFLRHFKCWACSAAWLLVYLSGYVLRLRLWFATSGFRHGRGEFDSHVYFFTDRRECVL